MKIILFSKLNLLIVLFLMINYQGISQKPDLGDKIKIGIVVDGNNDFYHDFIKTLETETKSLFAGSKYKIKISPKRIYISDWTVENIKKNIHSLDTNKDVEFIIGLGPTASSILANKKLHLKPTIAVGIIVPLLQNIPNTRDKSSGIKNFTYISLPYSPIRDIEVFHTLYPFKKIGIIVEQADVNSNPGIYEYAKNKMSNFNSDVKIISIKDNPNEVFGQLTNDIDAVYLGFLLKYSEDELRSIIKIINEKKLPSFSIYGEHAVKEGVLAGRAEGDNFSSLCRKLGMIIEKILDGKDPEKLTVKTYFEDNLVINMQTAREIDIYPPWEILSEAELLYEEDYTDAKYYNLQTVINTAIKNNLELIISGHTVKYEEQSVKQAKSNLFPQLEISGSAIQIDKDRAKSSMGQNPERTIKGSSTLTQLIYSEEAHANVFIQRKLLESSEFSHNQTLLDVIEMTGEAYFNILKARSYEKIQKDYVKLSKKNLKIVKLRESVGFSGSSDVYRWESEIAMAKDNYNLSKTQKKISETELNRILNLPLTEQFVLEDAGQEDSLLNIADKLIVEAVSNPKTFKLLGDFMIEEAKKNLPELNIIESSLLAQQRYLKSNRRSYYLPTVGLQGQADYVVDRSGEGTEAVISMPPPIGNINLQDPEDFSWSVGVSATLPIFRGGYQKAKIRKSEIEILKLENQKADVVNLLDQRIYVVLEQMKQSYNSIKLSTQAREAAKKNLELVQDAYSKGLISITQLIDAQNANLKSRELRINAIYDFRINIIKLERAIGKYYFLAGQQEKNEFYQRISNHIKSK